MRHSLEIGGRGRVVVAAYGIADAEHLIEKELGRLWPEARVAVEEVRRAGDPGRIVEEFEVVMRVRAPMAIEAPSRDQAVTEIFRLVRKRLQGSRYSRMELELQK